MASKRKSKDGVNKSQFIRDRLSKPVAEILADAKQSGVSLSAGLVYAVKSSEKSKRGSNKPGKPGKVGKVGKVASAAGLGNFDAAIRAIVREELRTLLSKV